MSRCQRTQAHQRCAVPVQNDNPVLGTGDRQSKANAHRTAHRTHHIKLIGRIIAGIQFTASVPGGRNDDCILWRRRLKYELLQDLLNDEPIEEACENVRKRYERLAKTLGK